MRGNPDVPDGGGKRGDEEEGREVPGVRESRQCVSEHKIKVEWRLRS